MTAYIYLTYPGHVDKTLVNVADIIQVGPAGNGAPAHTHAWVFLRAGFMIDVCETPAEIGALLATVGTVCGTPTDPSQNPTVQPTATRRWPVTARARTADNPVS